MGTLNIDWRWWILVVIVIGILLPLTCGCQYAFIHKRDIHEHWTLFKAYREFVQVKPEFDAELVNRGADDMQKTLELWKGDWDADE